MADLNPISFIVNYCHCSRLRTWICFSSGRGLVSSVGGSTSARWALRNGGAHFESNSSSISSSFEVKKITGKSDFCRSRAEDRIAARNSEICTTVRGAIYTMCRQPGNDLIPEFSHCNAFVGLSACASSEWNTSDDAVQCEPKPPFRRT